MLDFHLYLLFFLHQFGKFCQSRFISRIKMLETDLKNGKIMFFVNKNHRSERNFCHLRLCSVPILDQERKMTHFRVWVPYRELSKLSLSFLGMRWITDFKTKSGGGGKSSPTEVYEKILFSSATGIWKVYDFFTTLTQEEATWIPVRAIGELH